MKKCLIAILGMVVLMNTEFGGWLVGSGVLSAQGFSKVGTTGAKFLKLFAEPRGTAMAGACIAMADDKGSLYWNPAGMAFVDKTGLMIADMDWVVDIRNDFVGFVSPLGLSGTLGVSITALSMKKEQVTTVEQPEGTGQMFSAGSIAAGISYARKMTDKFAFGATVKYIQERIWDISSNGMAVDLGSWLIISDRIRGGFVITNFGPDMRFTGGHLVVDEPQEDWPEGYINPYPMEYASAPYALPLTFNMGMACDLIRIAGNRLTIGVVMSHPNDGCEKFRFGGEYGWNELFFLRAGYIWDEDARKDRLNAHENVSAGAGVKCKIGAQEFTVQYAAWDMGRLGLRNQVSVDFGF